MTITNPAPGRVIAKNLQTAAHALEPPRWAERSVAPGSRRLADGAAGRSEASPASRRRRARSGPDPRERSSRRPQAISSAKRAFRPESRRCCPRTRAAPAVSGARVNQPPSTRAAPSETSSATVQSSPMIEKVRRGHAGVGDLDKTAKLRSQARGTTASGRAWREAGPATSTLRASNCSTSQLRT